MILNSESEAWEATEVEEAIESLGLTGALGDCDRDGRNCSEAFCQWHVLLRPIAIGECFSIVFIFNCLLVSFEV